MLSYRHGFHAGNFADVLKHSILTLLINALKKKDRPFVYIDTHAGAGKYSLSSKFALTTGEFHQGVGRIWNRTDLPEEMMEYLRVVKKFNTEQLISYPGSPCIARELIRSQDRIFLSELHKPEFSELERNFKKDNKVSVSNEDGLHALIKKIPPIKKRGLIFIDPSYEIKSDFQKVVEILQSAHSRFTTGVYCLWYPVINRQVANKLIDDMSATGIRKQLRIEHSILPDSQGLGMTGSGLLIINPPWQLDIQAQKLLSWLNLALTESAGSTKVEWIVPE